MRELARNEDLMSFIKLNPHDLTMSYIKDLVCKRFDPITNKVTHPKYNLDDYFLLKAGECCGNTKDVITSVGIMIMNKLYIEPYLSGIVKYRNERFTSKLLGYLDQEVARNYQKNLIPFEAYEYHLNVSQSQGQLAEIVTPSYSEGTLTLPPGAKKLKAELLIKYKKELDAGDVVVANQVISQIIDKVKEELKDDPALENYSSGSKADFVGTYALMNIMQGPVKKQDGKYTIVTESYDEGISKENYVDIANSAVIGIKSRALDVAVGGTIQRTIIAMSQEEVFAGAGTDCGTKKTIEINLRDKFKETYLGMFIDLNGEKVHLTEKNIDKFVGRKINLYSPMRCEWKDPGYCEKCCGTHPAEFGIEKIGILGQGAGSALLNSNLKAFHVSTVKSKRVNPKLYLLIRR